MSQHIDSIVDEVEPGTELRRAKVNRTNKQGPVGVPVFLSSEEIEQLGINPEETDEVLIRVEDGFLLIEDDSVE